MAVRPRPLANAVLKNADLQTQPAMPDRSPYDTNNERAMSLLFCRGRRCQGLAQHRVAGSRQYGMLIAQGSPQGVRPAECRSVAPDKICHQSTQDWRRNQLIGVLQHLAGRSNE